MRRVGVFACVVVLLVVLASSFGCALPSAPSKAIKLRYSGQMPADHPATWTQNYFAEEVGKRSKGGVVVETYAAGELFSAEDALSAVRTGGVEMAYASGGTWPNPVAGFYNYFFLLSSLEHHMKAKEELGKVLFPILEQQNVKVIGWMPYGATGYTGKKPLVNPLDIKGLMVRAPNKFMNDSSKKLGAVPVSIASSELYDALSKGAIDGTFTAWSAMTSRKFYEVAGHYSGPFGIAAWLVFMNRDTWNSLPEDTKKIIMDVAKEAEVKGFEKTKAYDDESLAVLKAKGTVTIFSGKQLEAWVDAVRPTYDQWVAESEKAGFGNQARQILKVLDAAR